MDEQQIGVKGEVVAREPDRRQQVLTRRIAEAKAIVPDLAVTADADVEELGDADVEAAVVRSAALALREAPGVNGGYRDGRFETYSRVNVGVVVGAEGFFAAPVVFDADTKPVEQIAAELRELTERVRSGASLAPELRGATFTVLSAGEARVRAIRPVVIPPQAAILGVGSVEPRAVVLRDGTIAARRCVTLTLVCDHRALYADAAAAFLGRVRALLEDPAALA